jgi:hypothetical protein
VTETPYWIFFVRENAVVIGDRILVNSSFEPWIRVYDLAGDSPGAFGTSPPGWRAASAPPPVENLDAESRQKMIAAWSRSFSVVTQMAVVADSFLVVGYGHHDPIPSDANHIVHETIDIYTQDGTKLSGGLDFPWPIVAGGELLHVITEGPPWRITLFELVTPAR